MKDLLSFKLSLVLSFAIVIITTHKSLGMKIDCPVGCDSSFCQCSQAEGDQIMVACDGLKAAFFGCLNSSVIEFQLHGSSLKSISKEDFLEGKNLRKLDLSGNENFTAIGQDALITLERLSHLYLDHNALTELMYSIFPTSVEELRLNNNKLKTINYQVVFGSLSITLTHLRLGHNYLEAFTCPPLGHLVVLELQGNDLLSIKDSDFHDCAKLEELNLAANLIKAVDVNWSLIPELGFLDLSFNEIESLGLELHTSLTKLKFLMVSRNVLREVPALPPGLIALDLNGNLITKIQRNAFRNLTSLTYLEISDMPLLDAVEDEAFAGLVSLFSLRLQNNRKLRVLPVYPWPHSKELREIHLSHNDMRTFFREPFAYLDDLWIVVIAGNPLHCNCELAWIREEMDSEDNRWVRAWMNGTEAAICHSPENLRDFYISQLNAYDLTCEPAKLEQHSMSKTANGVVLEAVLARGVPSTIWFLPDGRHIVAHRNTPPISAISMDPLAEEFVLDNLTVISRLTIFASSQAPYAIEPGQYTLEYRTAGGVENYTFEVGPQTSSPPPSGSSGKGVVAIVVILSLVMVVMLAVGGYFGYRYYNARRQSRYQEVDEDQDVTSSSEQHVQEVPETLGPFRAGSTGYGAVS